MILVYINLYRKEYKDLQFMTYFSIADRIQEQFIFKFHSFKYMEENYLIY